MAWTGRMALDLFLFFVVAQRVLPGISAPDPSPGVAPRAVHARLRRGRPAALRRRPVPFPPDRPRHLLDHDVAPGPRA